VNQCVRAFSTEFEIGTFCSSISWLLKVAHHRTERTAANVKGESLGNRAIRIAEAEGKLLRLPTGDGGALVFARPRSAVLCAWKLATELKSHLKSRCEWVFNSGPVNEVTDLNEQANIAGAGINIAQRVMDCGDTGHILVSKRIADDLEQYPQWRHFCTSLAIAK